MKALIKILSWFRSRGNMKEKVAGVVVLAFFITVLLSIPFQVPPPSIEGEPVARSPRFFPYIVTITAMILSAGVLIKGFSRTSADASDAWEMRKGILGLGQVRRATPVIVIAVIYLLLFNLLGCLVAVMLCFAALMWYYGVSFRKEWKAAIPLIILLPLLLYYVFKSLLYVPLPSGILELFGIY